MSLLPSALMFCLLAAPPGNDAQDALETIERERGGRHWADAPTDPPKSPQNSLKCFQLEPGLTIELFAAEPLVQDPVAIAFDRRGRMFVAEYGDYPVGPPAGEPPLSRIVVLEDDDGDGQADRRTVFADKLQFAHSLMPFDGGFVVGAQTEILFLKDTDGDDRADVREVLFKGFVPAHPQMQIGSPRWGLDNWIYWNYGVGEITRGDGSDRQSIPRSEFRFHSRTREFGPASGMGQFGNTIDNWGRRFFCTNRNPIMTAAFSWEHWRRNPYAVLSKAHYDVGPSGGDTRVYPLVEMKSNYLSHAGTHTAACGVTAYRGDLLGPAYANNLFVCEPIGNLVTRSIVRPAGSSLTSERARPQADFLASTDPWFRPASLETGPDGALYLADMYRLWVEHPKFLPEDIAAKLDWRAGEDRGRIWRIRPADKAPSKFVPPETTADLVGLLGDGNGWRRSLGQQLLVERQASEAAPALSAILAHSGNPYARLHALWTLDGLGELSLEQVRRALHDPHPQLRRHGLILAERLLPKQPALLDELFPLAADAEIAVRFQLALALGETGDSRAAETLTKLALRDGAGEWFAAALLTSAKDRSGAILAGLVADKEFTSQGDAGRIRLVRELAGVVGARGDRVELPELLRTIAAAPAPIQWWQTAALSGLANGLPRHTGELGRIDLARLLASPPAALAGFRERLSALLAEISTTARDGLHPLPDRLAAIALLGHLPFDGSVFRELLATSQPLEVQLASLEALRSGGDAAAQIVLDGWPALGPKVRGPALRLLLGRTNSTKQALAAMQAGRMSPSVIDLDSRVRLLRHPDEAIRSVAASLLGGAVSSNRREVAEQYRAALELKGSAAEGARTYERICAKCHRLDGKGFEVGPDLSDVRNRSREALLNEILDPNQKVEPNFTDYVAVTADGRVFNGLMVSETAETIVLRQAEGKETPLPRRDIEELKASGKSLMPEGVEKEVTLQQMADLLEFLKTRHPN